MNVDCSLFSRYSFFYFLNCALKIRSGHSGWMERYRGVYDTVRVCVVYHTFFMIHFTYVINTYVLSLVAHT